MPVALERNASRFLNDLFETLRLEGKDGLR